MSYLKPSEVRGVQNARKISPEGMALDSAGVPRLLATKAADSIGDLGRVGVYITPSFVNDQMQGMFKGAAMDDAQGLVSTASVGAPVQFLQSWLPGLVNIVTGAREIKNLIGVNTVGRWEDEEVVQGVMEPVGSPALYGDSTNIPLGSFNATYERRSIVRFELGFSVSSLEELRSSAARINAAAEKRNAVALAFQIAHNTVGFYGYNGGVNRTYGFLNDPALPSYVTAAATGSGSTTTWATKTFATITADIRGMVARLQSASKNLVKPERSKMTLAVAASVQQYLTTPTEVGGVSVNEWIAKNYPGMRVESAPELDAANGGANVAYLYAEEVLDSGTDNRATWALNEPVAFRSIGVERGAKKYVEDFSSATAGVMVKRPYAVQRLTGV